MKASLCPLGWGQRGGAGLRESTVKFASKQRHGLPVMAGSHTHYYLLVVRLSPVPGMAWPLGKYGWTNLTRFCLEADSPESKSCTVAAWAVSIYRQVSLVLPSVLWKKKKKPLAGKVLLAYTNMLPGTRCFQEDLSLLCHTRFKPERRHPQWV